MELVCLLMLMAINSALLRSFVTSVVYRSTITGSPITFHRRPSSSVPNYYLLIPRQSPDHQIVKACTSCTGFYLHPGLPPRSCILNDYVPIFVQLFYRYYGEKHWNSCWRRKNPKAGVFHSRGLYCLSSHPSGPARKFQRISH